jgi:coenzyme PQQ biosynthesis protein PqqD
MTALNTILSHSSSIVAKKTGSEYVLVPLANNIADMNRVYTLNESGAFIWDLIDGKRTIAEIIEAMESEYDTTREKAEQDVLEFIRNLQNYLVILEK